MIRMKYTIEFSVTVCLCVYVRTIMFMKAKISNGLHNLKIKK